MITVNVFSNDIVEKISNLPTKNWILRIKNLCFFKNSVLISIVDGMYVVDLVKLSHLIFCT